MGSSEYGCYPYIEAAFTYISIWSRLLLQQGFPMAQQIKNPPAMQERFRFNSWVRRSPGRGNGNPLQYSCLGNPIDRGAWWTTIQKGHKESITTDHTVTLAIVLIA